MPAKSIRKSVSFDDSDGDRALLDAIANHQSKHAQSFSDLCKQALHQYLLSREPTQSVMLFMELQHQIAQLNVRVATLEDNSSLAAAFPQPDSQPGETNRGTHHEIPAEQAATPDETADDVAVTDDPVLSRLGPLLDEF
ncbi:hypothetical protein Lepto7375DRAFT_7614 [Leptolyngbya sp. PCC 7375]|nr:hypothetical protein Lepto7375DRAFT_7614 [Leptolyngbya sp. PCC 7375]